MMNAGAQTASTGPLAAGAADGGAVTDKADAAGRLLARLSVLPVLLLMAWLLAGLPLLLAGHFTPMLMLVVSVPLAVALAVFGLRWIPDRCQGVLSGPGPRSQHALVGGHCRGSGGGRVRRRGSSSITPSRSSCCVIRRPTPSSDTGSRTTAPCRYRRTRAAFGGLHKGFTFGSPAFYEVGDRIVPQFMAGLPMVLAAGFWIGGIGARAGGGAGARGVRNPHLRRPDRPAGRAAVGAGGGPGACALAS